MRDRLDTGLLPDPELAPVEWRLGEGLIPYDEALVRHGRSALARSRPAQRPSSPG